MPRRPRPSSRVAARKPAHSQHLKKLTVQAPTTPLEGPLSPRKRVHHEVSDEESHSQASHDSEPERDGLFEFDPDFGDEGESPEAAQWMEDEYSLPARPEDAKSESSEEDSEDSEDQNKQDSQTVCIITCSRVTLIS